MKFPEHNNIMEITSENVGAHYRFPAEWEPHEAIWLAWPRGDEVRGVSLFDTMSEFAITLIEHDIRVNLCVHDETERDHAIRYISQKLVKRHQPDGNDKVQELLNFLSTHLVPHGTYWTRDFGPIFMVPRHTSAEGAIGATSPIVLSFPWTCWGYKWNMQYGSFEEEMHQDGALGAISACVRNLKVLNIENFSSEGGDREFNGLDTLIVCKAVELQRNPGMTQEQVTQKLQQIFGVENIVWMNEGLADDRQIFRGILHSREHGIVFPAPGTGGHVDEFVRFVDTYKVLLADVPEEERGEDNPIGNASHIAMEENLRILQNVMLQNDRQIEIVRLGLPPPMIHEISPEDEIYSWYKNNYQYEDTPDGRAAAELVSRDAPIKIALAASYCNFLVTNNLVVAAKYHNSGEPHRASEAFSRADANAKRVLEEAFPGRKVVQLDCYAFNLAGGGFHCTSQQEPKCT